MKYIEYNFLYYVYKRSTYTVARQIDIKAIKHIFGAGRWPAEFPRLYKTEYIKFY